jgi:putative transposase
MPRISRAVAVGYPHHIIQRGNNRERVFHDEADKERYLSLLRKYSERWNSPVLAYCLMSNHVHILARPASEESLCKMMQGVTLCYTQYINRKYRRTGRLWESRYHSCIVEEEKYLWAVSRYIEQNPVRARMVKKAEKYPHSSAKAHISGMEDGVLGEALFSERERKDYIQLLHENMPIKEIDNVRSHTRTGRPLGGETFVRTLERLLKRTLCPMPKGRPRRDQNRNK